MAKDNEEKKVEEIVEIEEGAQFIGPRKVEKVVDEEFKTYGGNDTVTVHYSGGFSEFMPKLEFEAMVTNKPTDFTTLIGGKHKRILAELIAVLAEHDMKGGEIETITNGLSNELFNAFNKATHLLWTDGDNNNFTPGGNTVLERSLLEADKVIKQFPNTIKEDVK